MICCCCVLWTSIFCGKNKTICVWRLHYFEIILINQALACYWCCNWNVLIRFEPKIKLANIFKPPSNNHPSGNYTFWHCRSVRHVKSGWLLLLPPEVKAWQLLEDIPIGTTQIQKITLLMVPKSPESISWELVCFPHCCRVLSLNLNWLFRQICLVTADEGNERTLPQSPGWKCYAKSSTSRSTSGTALRGKWTGKFELFHHFFWWEGPLGKIWRPNRRGKKSLQILVNSKGIHGNPSQKCPNHSGLGNIVICPDYFLEQAERRLKPLFLIVCDLRQETEQVWQKWWSQIEISSSLAKSGSNYHHSLAVVYSLIQYYA